MRRVSRSGVGWLGFDGLPPAASINGGDEGVPCAGEFAHDPAWGWRG